MSDTSAGVSATLNPDGSSYRTVDGVAVVSAAPVNTAPYTVSVGDGTVTCQAAVTAGGYGRTCFYERGDGGFGVVGSTGYGSVKADGTVFRSGPIDRRDYTPGTGGTLNIGEAAVYIAGGADYEDAALRFDESVACGAISRGGSNNPLALSCDIDGRTPDGAVSLSWAEYQAGGSPRGNNPADVVINVVNGVKVGVEPMTAIIKNAFPFATVSFTVCFIICLGVFSQGGKLYGVIGIGLAVGAASSIGATSSNIQNRSCGSVSVAVGPLTLTSDVKSAGSGDKKEHSNRQLKSNGSGELDVGGALPKSNVGGLAGVYFLRYLGSGCV